MKNFTQISLFLLVGITLFSCRRDNDGPSWDTKILTPIISTELKIKDLVDTSAFLSTDANNLFTIEYNEEFYTLENPLDSLIGLSIEPFNTVFTLDNLGLDDIFVEQQVVLGDFRFIPVSNIFTFEIPDSLEIVNFTDPLAPGFPPPPNTLPPFTFSQDISSLLEEAVLSNADLYIRIDNNTEFDLENIKLEIKNTEDGFILVSRDLPTISAMDFYDNTSDLAAEIGDNPVKGELEISLSGTTINVPSDQAVSRFIYSSSIDFQASITDIQVSSAKAQFSEQEVINQEAPVDVNPGKTEKLTFARIENGIVNLRAFSTLPTDLSIVYAIPNLTQNGTEFELRDIISNDFSTSVNRKDTNFLFDSYEFDFTLPDADPAREFNSFLRRAIGTISATEGVQALSLDDTLGVEVSVTEIKPSYVRGFVGKEKFEFSDTIDFELINGLVGNLDFTNVSLDLFITNELGLDPSLTINRLISVNSLTGETASFNGNSGPFVISPATENGLVFGPVESKISINGAENLLSILPDKIVYDISVEINAGEDTLNPMFNDFLHSGASLTAGIQVKVPFELGSDATFSLMDTISFDQADQINIPDEFQNGTISILAENGFPLDADIKLYFLNTAGEIADSLTSTQVIQAARLDPLTGDVTERTESKIDFTNISNGRLTQMVDSPQVLFVATLATGGATDVSILDTYTMKIQLVGDFGYTLKSNF